MDDKLVNIAEAPGTGTGTDIAGQRLPLQKSRWPGPSWNTLSIPSHSIPTAPPSRNTLSIPSHSIPTAPPGYGPPMPFGPSRAPAAEPVPFHDEPRPELIDAVIKHESGGKAAAIGKKGERGLMQIMPSTAAMYGANANDLMNPDTNRQLGSRYLGDLLKRYKGNEFLALVAYNSGPGNVDKGRFLPQSIKYATGILADAQRPLQRMQAQPQAAEVQQPQPSMLSRIGGALEGTAYAEEPPSPPPGYGPVVAASAPPSGMPPPPPGYGPAVGPPATPLGQMKPSFTIGPGGMRMGLTTPNTPAQIQQQQLSGDVALTQINDAIKFYDQKILPKEHEFEGSLLTPGGRRGFAQPYAAQQSRYMQALGLGGKEDPDVAAFYDKIGPAISSQMRALIGGRLGYYIVNQSSLTPHLPNIDRDNLPRMREKLHDLQENIPLVVGQINKMRQQGLSDDQIIQQMGGTPGNVPMDNELPPEGFSIDQ